MATKAKLLWLGDDPAPSNVRQATEGRWDVLPYRADESLRRQLSATGIALACPNGRAEDPHQLERLLDAVERASAVAIILLPNDAKVAWGVLSRREGKFVCIRQDASPEEIVAKLAAAESLQPAIRNLQAELVAARNLGAAGGGQSQDLDEEMRLAARLQRDLLPRGLPEIDPVRFGVLYRPAGWVSGDIYDVARLDETHLGFYVADAVGHGMPAALLTMFIKRALPTKRIAGHAYEIIPPHESLMELNAAICEQNFSSCQFCTAVYCVLDVADLTLTYARAGHPEPFLIHADGSLAQLASPGSLLGVFPRERYISTTVPLSAGDRLVLYTDGIEDALAGAAGDQDRFRELLTSVWSVPREELLLRLTAWIDEQPATVRPHDDITVVTADIAP
ncbi:MAG: SpoIIE family protein phosphatase [Phycisphaerae bacterium]